MLKNFLINYWYIPKNIKRGVDELLVYTNKYVKMIL